MVGVTVTGLTLHRKLQSVSQFIHSVAITAWDHDAQDRSLVQREGAGQRAEVDIAVGSFTIPKGQNTAYEPPRRVSGHWEVSLHL